MTDVSRDTPLSDDEQLAEDLAGFYADPLGYVMYMWPWDTESAIQLVELTPEYYKRFPGAKCINSSCPGNNDTKHSKAHDHAHGLDQWACEFLDQLGADIKERNFDGTHAVQPIQYTTSSGHGIGKTVLVAMLIKFIADTRPFSRGIVTANTSDQLRTKTWAGLGMWHRLSLTSHWFTYTSGRNAMSLYHNDFKEEWRCDAQTCREENSEAFAGLHAANSTPYYIFDEASAVPNSIFEVREGGTTDGEPMTFDFGNPTRNSGRFFDNCKGKFKKDYRVLCVDSRNVQITNKDRIDRWIAAYGEDSDFVKVRVKGEFPSVGSMQFIGTADVDAAMEREPVVDRYAPLIIGVDVARFGDDDTVIYPRIGNDARSFPIERYKGLDTIQVSGKVIECIRRFRAIGMDPSAVFVDGGGIGAGVVDYLRHLGYDILEVQFGGGATDKEVYRFKSDEMWGTMREAIATKLVLPKLTDKGGVELKDQLTQREFGYTIQGNKVHLESKKDMKERLGGEAASPDIADALALTYAQEVAPLRVVAGERTAGKLITSEFDPLDGKY
ncbi:MAG TPA: terminase [Porticoccus sp.]|nr:terminase [Porticoccus sp.]